MSVLGKHQFRHGTNRDRRRNRPVCRWFLLCSNIPGVRRPPLTRSSLPLPRADGRYAQIVSRNTLCINDIRWLAVDERWHRCRWPRDWPTCQIDEKHMRTADFTRRRRHRVRSVASNRSSGICELDALTSDLSSNAGDFGADGLGNPVSQLTK